MESECRFSEVDKLRQNYETSDINPFCENMRDPGSEDHEVCVGYFDAGSSSLAPDCTSLLWFVAPLIHCVI